MSSFLHRLQKNASLMEEALEQWLPTAEEGADRILREAMDHAEGEEAKQIRLAAEISRKILEGREVVL